MSNKVVMRIGRGGHVRAIHADGYDFQRVHGCGPARRASHVEPIQSGPLAGWWHVDMSPLGPEYNYCLWPPHSPTERAAALAAEVKHLTKFWILKDAERQPNRPDDRTRENEAPTPADEPSRAGHEGEVADLGRDADDRVAGPE